MAKYGNELREQREWARVRSIISTTLNTVAKETIRPDKIMTLPFIDRVIEYEVMKVKTESEARQVLKELRGF